VPVVVGVGTAVWIAAAHLLRIGSRRFTRDRLAGTA
jgi:hypothetical protein